MIRVVLDYDPQRQVIVTVHVFLAHEAREAEACRDGLKREHPKRMITMIESSCLAEAKRRHAKLVAGQP